MKMRTVAAALGLLVLGAAGYAVGAGVGVTLTASGPQPETVTINWGDTVTYSNGDSVAHGITIPRAEVASPSIPPGGIFEHVFDARGGNYNFVQQGTRNHAGRVVVRVDGTASLRGTPTVVPFGKALTLSGQSSFPGKPVVIRGREAGAGGEWKNVFTLTAGPDGAFSVRTRPQIGSRYQARVAADQISSRTIDVAVRPAIGIALSRRAAPAGTTITVTGKIRPASAVDRADLSGYDTRQKRWVILASQPVTKTGKVAFRLKVEEGSTRLRISARRASTSAGYTPAESRFVRLVGTKTT
jgi:plastocyanin